MVRIWSFKFKATITSSFSYVSDVIWFAFAGHANIVRQFTTPIDMLCNLLPDWATTAGRLLGVVDCPFWECWREVLFPRSQRYITADLHSVSVFMALSNYQDLVSSELSQV